MRRGGYGFAFARRPAAGVSGQVTLSWDAVASATDYFVEIGSEFGQSDVANIDTGSTSTTYTTTLASGTYYARIRAVVGGVEGLPSDELTIVVP